MTIEPDATPEEVQAFRDAYELGCAWAEAEAALPEGWIVSVGPSEDWAVGDIPEDEPQWVAGTCSRSYFNGETDADDQQASGSGPTPAAALRALVEKLRAFTDARQEVTR